MLRGAVAAFAFMLAAPWLLTFTAPVGRLQHLSPALVAGYCTIGALHLALRALREYVFNFGGGRCVFDRATATVTFAFGGSCRLFRCQRIQCRRLELFGRHYCRFALKADDVGLLVRQRYVAETRSLAATKALAAELGAFMGVDVVDVRV